jgi:hypothetical protein
MNILIIEDQHDDANTIFNTLTSRYTDIQVFPFKNTETDKARLDMELMYSLISRCNQYAQESKSDIKETKKQELINFLKNHVVDNNKIDIIILDVALHPNQHAHEINGAKVRAVLNDLYPGTKVIFCTTKAKVENFQRYKQPGDFVIYKNAWGSSVFGKHFSNQFKKFLKNNNINLDQNLAASSDQPPAEKEKSTFQLAVENNEWGTLIGYFGQFLLSAFVFLAIAVFLIGTVKYLFEFAAALYNEPKEKLISHLLHTLEMFFIIPLPMIIITSFIIYCKKVLSRHFFYKLGEANAGIETDSKYYIGVSKSLFVSTLMSVLSINLLEISLKILSPDPESEASGLKNLSWQEMGILGLTIAILLLSYFMIEKSIHHVIELNEKRKED